MILIRSSLPSGAQVTDFFLPSFFSSFTPTETLDGVALVGGGVDVAGDSVRGFRDFMMSSKGLNDDGCATFESASFLTCTAAFLKSGSFGFGFAAEKKDESVFASLIGCLLEGFLSEVVLVEVTTTVLFLTAGAPFGGCGGSSALRFLEVGSIPGVAG